MKTYEEDHDEHKFRRFILFEKANDPSIVPPHIHIRDHLTKCIHGKIEVTLAHKVIVMNSGDEIFVPAKVMHSAIALEVPSRMVCEFDHFDKDGHPSSVLGPLENYT